jgi:hypothetical protein
MSVNVMILKIKREKTLFFFFTKHNTEYVLQKNKYLSYVRSLYVQEYRHAKIKTLYKIK